MIAELVTAFDNHFGSHEIAVEVKIFERCVQLTFAVSGSSGKAFTLRVRGSFVVEALPVSLGDETLGL